MSKSRKFRWTRARRRVLLALLSGATGLSGFFIMRAAQTSSATTYVTLAHLERLGWVIRYPSPPALGVVRQCYKLTPEGRSAAFGVLGLVEGTSATV